MTRPPEAEPLLTPAEVATLFRVDPKTVTRWAKAGRITSIRTLGGHRRYRETEVRDLLAGNTPPPPPEKAPAPGKVVRQVASHQCGRDGCTRQLPLRLLLCGGCWALVPKPLQRAVSAAYRGGAGLGSAELLAAQEAAIAAVNGEPETNSHHEGELS
jgi:excisionase family DNA binding protein